MGASGYVGGELLRLLLYHPKVEVTCATSQQYKGEFLHRIHPNLRGSTSLQFIDHDLEKVSDLCDLVFTAVPHGSSLSVIPRLVDAGLEVIDMAADFRFRNPDDYIKWYGFKHPYPELLDRFVYGLPELHRNEIRDTKLISVPGCMALTSILALAPLVKSKLIDQDRIVVDSKIGSSGGGVKPSLATHHSERYGVIRPYKPVGHRHTGEIEQELTLVGKSPVKVAMSPHAINIVRGVLCTNHVFPTKHVTVPEVWKTYRAFYRDEPFIRFVSDKQGVHRFPDPKVLVGSNYCDIGFELDSHTSRLVVLSATDNLMKGAAGSGVQCMNISSGFDEQLGLEFPGVHPV